VGLDDLVDMVLLVADLQELKANPNRPRSARSSRRAWTRPGGPVGTVLVQTGTLNVGDVIVVGETFGRVARSRTSTASASRRPGPRRPRHPRPVQVPEAGDILRVVADEKAARPPSRPRPPSWPRRAARAAAARPSRTSTARSRPGQAKELRIVLKADVSGSLGAITHALGQLQDGRGQAQRPVRGRRRDHRQRHPAGRPHRTRSSSASTPRSATPRGALAEVEKVDVRLYDIIYQLTDDIEKALSGLLEPSRSRSSRAAPRSGKIIKVGAPGHRRLVRHGRPIVRSAACACGVAARSSHRQDRIAAPFKDDVREVQTGFECGIALPDTTDIQEGDVLECFTTQTVSRSAVA
jgi:translation initiation factor IF-2